MIHASPLPDVEIPDIPLTDYVLEGAAARGDKPALIDGPTGRVLTYAQLVGAVRSLAGGLVSHGFAPGDVLALMSPNIPEYAVVFHAVAMAGGTITTINPTYTAREVHHQLVDSGARLLVTVAPFLDIATEALADTAVTETYIIGEVPEGAKALPLTSLMGAPQKAMMASPIYLSIVPLPFCTIWVMVER